MNNNDLRKALENLHREALKLYATLGYQGQLDWHKLGTALQQAEYVLRINRQVNAENRRALGLDATSQHFMDDDGRPQGYELEQEESEEILP